MKMPQLSMYEEASQNHHITKKQSQHQRAIAAVPQDLAACLWLQASLNLLPQVEGRQTKSTLPSQEACCNLASSVPG